MISEALSDKEMEKKYMDLMLEKLKEYGADVDGAMGRFLDDTDLYKTCFSAFLKDEAFKMLGKSLAVADYEKAFEYAHTLKGITGNMGFTPLYMIICNIVETLRKKESIGIEVYYAEVLNQLKQLKILYNLTESGESN